MKTRWLENSSGTSLLLVENRLYVIIFLREKNMLSQILIGIFIVITVLTREILFHHLYFIYIRYVRDFQKIDSGL